MDWLAVFVAVAVLGQLCLPLVGAYRDSLHKSRAKRRADLLEAAADQQLNKVHADLHTGAPSPTNGASLD